MSLLNLTQAAQFVNKSSQTLYRYIKAGKLSRRSDGYFDTAELIRVFGDQLQTDTTKLNNRDTPLAIHDTSEVEYLRQQIEQLQHQLEQQRIEHLEREKRLMALLEHQMDVKPSGIKKWFS